MTLEEGTAADGRAHSHRAEKFEIGDIANSSGSLPFDLGETSQALSVKIDVRAGESAIASDIGAQHMLQSGAEKLLDGLP